MFIKPIITVCKRSFRKLCFCTRRVWQGGVRGGGHAWPGGWVCMAGEHAWQGVCVAEGLCMAWGVQGRGVSGMGVHGRGHAWQKGGGMCGGDVCPHWQILRDTVNEWAVSILLECILVFLRDFQWSRQTTGSSDH